MAPQGDGTALRVDFWYIDDDSQVFLPISPVNTQTNSFRRLRPIPGICSTSRVFRRSAPH